MTRGGRANGRLVLASMLAVLMCMNASAFHIQGNVDPVTGMSSEEWSNPNMGLTLCESDGTSDPINNQPNPASGRGGLCYMDYPGASNTTAPAAGSLTEYDMTQANGQDFSWFATAGDASCIVDVGETLVVDNLYLFWQTGSDQTHVAGFPEVQPAVATGVPVDARGGYTATSVASSDTPCDEPHLPVMTTGTAATLPTCTVQKFAGGAPSGSCIDSRGEEVSKCTANQNNADQLTCKIENGCKPLRAVRLHSHLFAGGANANVNTAFFCDLTPIEDVDDNTIDATGKDDTGATSGMNESLFCRVTFTDATSGHGTCSD